jgi:penicillin-binding protein 1B
MARTGPKRRSRSRKGRRRRAKRGARVRAILGLLTLVGVVAAGTLLFLYVGVTTRFDGRLWTLPSRVYSDRLVLTPGARYSPEQLAARLERSGYAGTDRSPGRPGQYRQHSGGFDVYSREFSTPDESEPARRFRIRFDGSRVRSINDGSGTTSARVVFEPELLTTIYGSRQEERSLIRLEGVPRPFVGAVLAAEDADFYAHSGLDFTGIARAALTNLRKGRIVQGGSTITQQTVKNLYLGQERTWWRKIREVALALILDARYDKDRILEVYLNEVYFGQRGAVAICGAQAAARFYFGRDLRDLSLGEWATLAGLIRSPGRYNPFAHPERAAERRDRVLAAMQRLGLATPAEVEAALSERLQLASGGGGSQAPYVADFVRAELAERFSLRTLSEEGLTIYTTLNTRIQHSAEEVLGEGLERLERERPAIRRQLAERSLQGAVVVTHPATGAILALVGGRDYRESQFNRAVQARRQPGSCFKPFVFAAGFEKSQIEGRDGLTPATLLDDSPVDLPAAGKRWTPSNYDGDFRGPVTARRALEESLNVPTVRAAQLVGLQRIVETAQGCGIESPLAPLPSLALGTEEVTPLELAAAYGTFSQQGSYQSPWLVRTVVDAQGRELESGGTESIQAITPQSAYLVSEILHGVFVRGTARSAAGLGYRDWAAGKTGTTDDTRDAWFVGYDRDLLALVWVGYDDNARTGLSGATGALPIWVELMNRCSAQRWNSGPPAPDGLVTVGIDPESGMRAVSRCPLVIEEHFVAGTQPEAMCPLHQGRFRRWLKNLGRRKKEV